MKILSLASVNVVINNSNRGDIISFGGAGKLLGEVSYSFSGDLFGMKFSDDGGFSTSFTNSVGGSIEFKFNQISAAVDTLNEYILWCRDNPELASADITVSDSTGVMKVRCQNCVPKNYPSNKIGSSPEDKTYSFYCGIITPEEYLKEN